MFIKEKSKLLHIITPLFFILSLIIYLISSPINIKQVKASISPIPNPSVLGFFSDIGEAYDVVSSLDGTKTYIASDPFGVVIVDTSNPANPKVLGSQHPSGLANQLAISNNIVIATGTPRGTDIVDVSNSNYPEVLSSVEGVSLDVAVSGNYAYIISAGNLMVVNIENPSDPQVITTVTIPGIASGIAISDNGNTAVVSAVISGINVLDISNPSSPTITGSRTLGGVPGKVAISGNLALVANGSLASMQVIDISNPITPELISAIETGSIANLVAKGSVAYVSANGEPFRIINISNPENLTFLSEYSLASSACAVNGDTVFSVQINNGLTILDTSVITDPTPIGSLGTGKYEATRISAGLLSGGQTVVIASGTPRGTDIIDVSNPKYPKISASIEGASVDAAVNGDFAYIISLGNLKVFNIANPSAPQEVMTFEIPGIASGIAISEDGNTAVVSAALNGMHVLDISNPSSPTIIGSTSLEGVAARVAISGNLALITNISLASMQVVDISNPSTPELKSTTSTGSIADVRVKGNIAYVAANGFGFKIIDIINPDLPEILSTYNLPTSGCAILGNVAFITQVNYGLTVVDISDSSNPIEITNTGKPYSTPSVFALDDMVYTSSSTAELVIFDIYHDTPTFKITVDKYNVNSGDEVTYTITLHNVSPNTLTNFNLTDPILDGTTYIEGGTYNSGTNTVSWTIPEMATDQTIVKTFKVSIN